MRVCAYCGADFAWERKPGQPGRTAMYCSSRCRGRAIYERGRLRHPHIEHGLTPEQRSANSSVAALARWSAVDADDRSAAGSKLARARYTDEQRAHAAAERERKAALRVAPCVICGKPVGSAQRKTCSQECKLARIAEKMRTVNAVRQRATSGIEVEQFRPVEIFARDGWACGICGDPVDPSVRHPDKLSATIDHIVPLSLGGAHTRKNVRLAHLVCNSRRGNRVAA